jgi:hypothetical protein
MGRSCIGLKAPVQQQQQQQSLLAAVDNTRATYVQAGWLGTEE